MKACIKNLFETPKNPARAAGRRGMIHLFFPLRPSVAQDARNIRGTGQGSARRLYEEIRLSVKAPLKITPPCLMPRDVMEAERRSAYIQAKHRAGNSGGEAFSRADSEGAALFAPNAAAEMCDGKTADFITLPGRNKQAFRQRRFSVLSDPRFFSGTAQTRGESCNAAGRDARTEKTVSAPSRMSGKEGER